MTSMENNSIQNTIVEEPTQSNSLFWWFMIILSIVIVVSIYLYWDHPIINYITGKTPTPKPTPKPTSTSTSTPSPSPSPTSTPTSTSTPSTNANANQTQNTSYNTMNTPSNTPIIYGSTELTNTAVSATHENDLTGGGTTSNLNDAITSNTTYSSSNVNPYNDTSLDTALNNAAASYNSGQNEPSADDAYTSSIQTSKTSSKAGWCYIGEERGFRTCMKVGQNDECMSGNIFPSQDICINPSLRA